ncbi:MAG: hypothetical protein K2H70_01555, partial [Bacteroidales bacterium]|nr:hypothetical protein [Bacteroidales bacterium]
MAKRKIDFTVRDAWDQDSLLLYKEAVSRYPYCAPARLCFLLNLRALDDPDYERELTLTALSVPDRQRLRTEVEAVEARLAAARPEKENRWGRSVTARKAAGAGAVASGRRMTEGLGGARQAALADGERAEGVAAALGRAVDFGAVAANEPVGRRGGEAIVSRPVAVPEPAIVSRPAPEPEPAIVSRPVAVPEPAIVSRPAPEPEPSET